MNGIVHKNPVGHNTRGIALDKVNIYKWKAGSTIDVMTQK